MSIPKNKRTFTLNNTNFYFESKFIVKEIVFVNVNVLSKQLQTIFQGKPQIEKQTFKSIIFARSKSECGMWRLCVTKPGDVGNNFYLQKGIHYTMSAFIILEIQMFLNSILDYLDEVTEDIEPCISQYKKINKTLQNTKRRGESIDFEKCNFDFSSIKKLGDYSYTDSFSNPHPVNVKNIKDYKKLNTEEKKLFWPKNAIEIGIDANMDYGLTVINLYNGSLYSVKLTESDKHYYFYYMIYSCEIEIPESIHQYTTHNIDSNKDYVFEKKIKVKNLIVPIYVIPYDESNDNNCLDFGLYDTYIPMNFNGKNIEFSKILNYIQQCRNINKSYIPTCNTSYKFTGYYYDDIFNEIKVKTLNILKAKKKILHITLKKNKPKSKSRSLTRSNSRSRTNSRSKSKSRSRSLTRSNSRPSIPTNMEKSIII